MFETVQRLMRSEQALDRQNPKDDLRIVALPTKGRGKGKPHPTANVNVTEHTTVGGNAATQGDLSHVRLEAKGLDDVLRVPGVGMQSCQAPRLKRLRLQGVPW